MSNDLLEKRRKALAFIGGITAGTGVATAVLSWLFGKASEKTQTSMEIALTGGSHILLCAQIYYAYYGESMSTDKIKEMLLDAGVITVIPGVAGYVLTKNAPEIASSFSDDLGSLSALAPSLVASSGVAILGLAWMFIVDDAYNCGCGSLSEHINHTLD